MCNTFLKLLIAFLPRGVKPYIALVACLHSASLAYSQVEDHRLQFTQYSTLDGLMSNAIMQVYQDETGFIWVATRGGLSRFDGYKFHYYPDRAEENVVLKDALGFFEDSRGQLWVTSIFGYLYRYDRAKDEFIEIPRPSSTPDPNEVPPAGIEGSDGNLWFSGKGGIDKYESETGQFTHYPLVIDEKKVRLGKMCKDRSGNLWIGGHGLFYFNPDEKKFHQPQLTDSLPIDFSRIWTVNVFTDSSGFVW